MLVCCASVFYSLPYHSVQQMGMSPCSLKQLHLSGNSISKIGFSGLEATSVPTSSELIKGGVGFEKLETLLLGEMALKAFVVDSLSLSCV